MFESSMSQSDLIQIRACAVLEHDESKKDPIMPRRPPLLNLSVNSQIRKLDPPESGKFGNSTEPKLRKKLRGTAPQNNQKPNTNESEARDSIESSSNCAPCLLPKGKLQLQDDKEEVSTPSEVTIRATGPMRAGDKIFTIHPNLERWSRQSTVASWSLRAGDINTKFDDPHTVFPALQSLDCSLMACSRLRPPPKSMKAISHNDRVNLSDKADDKADTQACDTIDQQFILRLKKIVDKSNEDTPARPRGKYLETSSLLRVVPPKIVTHFLQNDKACLSMTSGNRRCKIRHNTKDEFPQIQSIMSFNAGPFMEKIQKLIQVSFCHVHRKLALREIQTWKEEFREFTEMHAQNLAFMPQEKRLQTFIRWICLLRECVDTELPSGAQHLPTEHAKTTLAVDPIQVLNPYKPRRLTGSVYDELAKLVAAPLRKADVRWHGSIYIFWQRPNFGHLKIGRAKDVRGRLKQWNTQCQKEMTSLFPDLSEKSNPKSPELQGLPHIARIEDLVHVELMNYRRCEPKCPGCGKQHIEWFATSHDHAVRVVQKWNAWMATLPYERRTIHGKEEWVLRDQEKARINQLCQPERASLPPGPVSMRERRHTRRSRNSHPREGPGQTAIQNVHLVK